MSASVGQIRVKDAHKQLQARWARARAAWDDQAATDFERTYIEPLAPRVAAAATAMGKLAELIRQCRRECE